MYGKNVYNRKTGREHFPSGFSIISNSLYGRADIFASWLHRLAGVVPICFYRGYVLHLCTILNDTVLVLPSNLYVPYFC